MRALGGTTTLQETANERVFKCFSLAEGGLLCLALKNSVIVFSIIDIFIGVLALLRLIIVTLNGRDYRIFYGYDGFLIFLSMDLWFKPLALIVGISGLVAALRLDLTKARLYYKIKIVEMILLPSIGVLSIIDMNKSYIYHRSTEDIITTQIIWSLIIFFYYFYVAYIAKSFHRRLEKGELILASHGR